MKASLVSLVALALLGATADAHPARARRTPRQTLSRAASSVTIEAFATWVGPKVRGRILAAVRDTRAAVRAAGGAAAAEPVVENGTQRWNVGGVRFNGGDGELEATIPGRGERTINFVGSSAAGSTSVAVADQGPNGRRRVTTRGLIRASGTRGPRISTSESLSTEATVRSFSKSLNRLKMRKSTNPAAVLRARLGHIEAVVAAAAPEARAPLRAMLDEIRAGLRAGTVQRQVVDENDVASLRSGGTLVESTLVIDNKGYGKATDHQISVDRPDGSRALVSVSPLGVSLSTSPARPGGGEHQLTISARPHEGLGKGAVDVTTTRAGRRPLSQHEKRDPGIRALLAD